MGWRPWLDAPGLTRPARSSPGPGWPGGGPRPGNVLTGPIRSFGAWVGDGRKLTQTRRIRLVDARHLVELLGTGDTIDPKIGDRVFKTKSSEELGYLTRLVEWAKAARLVRVSGRARAAAADHLAGCRGPAGVAACSGPRGILSGPGAPGDSGRHGLAELPHARVRVGELSYGPDPEGILGHLDEAKVRLGDVAEVDKRIGYESRRMTRQLRSSGTPNHSLPRNGMQRAECR
jgi:hypothetical protein